MKKAEAAPNSALAKALLYLQLFAGVVWVLYLLWTGVGTIPKTFGGEVYSIDRDQSPILFWFLVIGISFALIGLPVKFLWQGRIPNEQHESQG